MGTEKVHFHRPYFLLEFDLWGTDVVYAEKLPFQLKNSPFRPIAAIWAILEHLYSEIADEPPFHRGLLLSAHAKSAFDANANEP